MHKRHLIQLTTCCLLTGMMQSIIADTDPPAIAALPAEIKRAILLTFKTGIDEIEFVKGNLDNDAIPDLAAIVQFKKDGIQWVQAVIFKGLVGGEYVYLAETSGCESHQRRTDSIQIRNGSIFLSTGSSTYTGYSSTALQFKLMGRQFRHIGIKSERGTIGNDRSDWLNSVNLLTSKSIEVSGHGMKKKVTNRSLRVTKAAFLESYSFCD